MKGPKVLKYDWEDLTGTEEIENYFVDDLRRTLVIIKANGQDRNFLRALFERQAGYVLACPGSDLCVILYRLLKPISVETLKTIYAINLADGAMSFLQFIEMVEAGYALKPIPVVLGEVPGINL